MKLTLFTVIIIIGGLFSNLYAQESEHVVILWDVTGSLLPSEPGVSDYDGSDLKTYSKGNGLWMELKKAVIECIEYSEEDPSNKITIVTFQDKIRRIYSQNASKTGKDLLKKWVKEYKYEDHHYTNIVEPVEKFYTFLYGNHIKYMFLFTDGDNDQPLTKHQLIPTLDSWTAKTKDKNAYGFYVLVHPNAAKKEIIKSIEKQENFWIVQDAKTRIKFCKLPSNLMYNTREEKGPKTIYLEGKRYVGAEGYIQLLTDDAYYDVICTDSTINDGKLNFEVRPKEGKTHPVKHTLVVTPKINSDPYTIVAPKHVYCEVSSLPDRVLELTIDENQWGEGSYYDTFFFGLSKESYTPIVSNIKVNFSNQAKAEGSSAIMKVYLVDDTSEKKMEFSSKKFKLVINGEEIKGDTIVLTPEMTAINLSIIGQSKTEDGRYYGRIELIPKYLDKCSINGAPEIYKWNFDFKNKWNPVKKIVVFGGSGLFVAFLLWIICFRPMFYPKFGSIQKTLNVPGMAPLIIKFKGARMVVVTSKFQKKQSLWNVLLKGRILYKIHPEFDSPLMFKPSRDRKILAIAKSGSYHIVPNPMPEIGHATITNTQNNKIISVN